MPVLSQIYVYPVKSLAGIRVEQWPVDKTGLRYDRKWMLVDENGQFLSQRRLPNMALIQTRIVGEQLILSAPSRDDLTLALHSGEGDDLEVEIWHDRCLANTAGQPADAWFSAVLNRPCRLVYHPDDRIRQVDQKYAQERDETAFSDGFPFLVVSEASLQHFNRTANLDLAVARFRPNLVIGDCDSYAEDRWRQIAVNGIRFRLPKPCSRCSVPAVDPDTAAIDKTVLTALARLRQWQNKVYFGQNALHDTTGQLTVGDPVAIEQIGAPQPPLYV